MPREALLVQTFVELADTLVDDFDIVDLLVLLTDRCVAVLDVTAAGLMLVAPEGDLRVVAASSESMRVVELFEIQAREGPCLDAFGAAAPLTVADLAGQVERWPAFTPVALKAGFRSVHAVPMRLRGQVIGVLNLFCAETRALAEGDLLAAQAMADVATIAILQHRAAMNAQILNDQLNNALNSRIVIEQAKGMVAQRAGVEMPLAFALLRGHARRHNLRLDDVARGVIDGTLPVESLGPPPPAP